MGRQVEARPTATAQLLRLPLRDAPTVGSRLSQTVTRTQPFARKRAPRVKQELIL